MKKILLIFVIVFLLFSCDIKEYYHVLITNDSSKIVSYLYNENSDTLEISESKNYEVKAYTVQLKDIVDQNGIASIKMNANGMTGNYTFIDITEIELNVMNTLPFDIIITANNYIDNADSMELEIKSGETEIANIYTEKPDFTFDTDYPVVYEYDIITLNELDKYGKPKKQMFVIIK